MESAKELQGRILLVDDESAILRTFRYCLEDEGYTVATANSAAQADALIFIAVLRPDEPVEVHQAPLHCSELHADRLSPDAVSDRAKPRH